MIRSLDGAISSLARCFVITVVVGLFNITISAQTANDTSPGPNGEPLPNREEAGFSSSRLHALTDLLKTGGGIGRSIHCGAARTGYGHRAQGRFWNSTPGK